MKRINKFVHLFIAVVLLASPGLKAQEDGTLDNKIKSLINELSAPEYSVRENAKEKLLGIGEPAVKHLEKAIENEDDIELIEGAEEVLEKIKERIKPKEPPDIRHHGQTFTFRLNPGMKSNKSFQFALTNPNGESVIMEETEDSFILTATKDNVTKKYQAKTKEEFKEKFPEIYNQYKNIIDGNSFTIVTRTQPVPSERNRQDQDPLEKWFNMPRFSAEQYRKFVEQLEQFEKGFDQDFFGWDNQFGQEFKELERKLDELLREFNSFRHTNKDFKGRETPGNNNWTQKQTVQRDPAKRKLGLSLDVLTEGEAEKRGLEFDSIYVKKIEEDSLLFKEGLREGDAIVEVNDSKVNTTYLVRKKLVELLENNGGKIVINRNGEFKELKVKFDTY